MALSLGRFHPQGEAGEHLTISEDILNVTTGSEGTIGIW